MGDAKFTLRNGLNIDAENPEYHVKPEFCSECKVFYYFGGHLCTERSKAFKRGMQGYYDGE